MLFLLAGTTFFFTACGGDEPANVVDEMYEEPEGDTTYVELEISEETLEQIIHSIPTPVEMNVLIRASGASYYGDVLHKTSNYDKYTTSYKKALNLGVYGADLGYLNIYEKTGTSIDYLKTIKDLSDDLHVGQFFDFETLQRLAASSDDSDSLIIVSTKNFNKMNKYLRDQKRGKISVLLITGTFIEGLNIASQLVKNNPNDQIREKIGEQKLTVNDLLLILEVYKKDPEMADLIADVRSLKEEMDQVEIVTTVGEPIAKEVDGALVIEQTETSEIKMSDELLTRIIEKTESIRKKIIS